MVTSEKKSQAPPPAAHPTESNTFQHFQHPITFPRPQAPAENNRLTQNWLRFAEIRNQPPITHHPSPITAPGQA
jgi:hypothetical protein